MMCLGGLTVGQAARIGMGIGLFIGGAALAAVLAFEAWAAWRTPDADGESAAARRGETDGEGNHTEVAG